MTETTTVAEPVVVEEGEAKRGYAGQNVPRKEDKRLVQGEGVFFDDIKRHGMGYVHFVRSPYAHAKIVSIDVSKALELGGDAVKSCMLLAVQADGKQLHTIEGLAPDDELTPLQRSFSEHHALQCGYCTPGMLMSATALLRDNPRPTDEEITRAIQGNICRCTGYVNIVEAIKAASQVAP